MKKKLTIQNGTYRISLDTCSLKYEIIANGVLWANEGRKKFLLFYKKAGKRFLLIPKKFSSAKSIVHNVVQGDNYCEIESIFSKFKVLNTVYEASITTKAKLFDDGRIDFCISEKDAQERYLHGINWPGSFNRYIKKQKMNDAVPYSVGAYRQGYLAEDKAISAFDKIVMTAIPRDVNTGDCYMPLWGRVYGCSGYSAYIDDANDAAVWNTCGKKGAVLSAPYFKSSLGKLNYERILHMRFYDKCDYNDFAHEYRSFLQSKGKLVTIKDKIKANPNVAKLIGTPVIHTNIYAVTQPESKMYKPATAEVLFATFEERAKQFEKFHELGLEKAYVHLDGWGKLGYDNLHPYILPPCPNAGGAEGMKFLADTCERIEFIFGLHDQYRDFYTRSPEYDLNKAVQRINGTSYFCDTWLGGAHNWLCASFAPSYVKRTYDELDQLGIKVKGAYLDVFSIVQGDECFNESHKLTRTESISYRKACFDMLRERGMIVCSEEPGALMVNEIDLVHHAPYKTTPQEGGKRLGHPIPLFNLVYHDCIFVPWCVDGKGGWGIPNNDAGELHCILNAQTPYFNGLNGTHMQNDTGILSDAEIAARIEKVKRISAIQAKLYDKAMIKHEFVSANKRVQKCTYSDGTEITVNFDKGTYKYCGIEHKLNKCKA